MKDIGIFYGSTTGHTEKAAYRIAHELGVDTADVFNVIKAEASWVLEYANIMLGCSTWEMGDLQARFEFFLAKILKFNLEGRKVAIYGCGDQISYPDTFADAIGIIYQALQFSGCKIVGRIPAEGYAFSRSKAMVDGLLVGLPLDEINQPELSPGRIKKWVGLIRNEFSV